MGLGISYLVRILKAIARSRHGKMKLNRFIIEHLGLLGVVVVICDISLKTGDLKSHIPDPAHRSRGEFR